VSELPKVTQDKQKKKAAGRAKRAQVGRDTRRGLYYASIAVAGLLAVALLLTLVAGSAVRADVGCGACHGEYATAHGDSAHADTRCAVCHAQTGLTGLFSDGIRAVRWAAAAPFVDAPGATSVSEQSCRECHAETLGETVVARGVRVRHSDFLDEPCATCHAGRSHAVAGRWYLTPDMELCMQCHRAIVAELTSCEVCHPPDAPSERSPGWSAWRAAHGEGWEQAHGMGDLGECATCHPPQYCIECHEVPVPHRQDWPQIHGKGISDPDDFSKCDSCHEPDWCVSCHGIEMPHPAGFLPDHGAAAEDAGEEACARCHSPERCDVCHFESSHPNLPTVGMGAHSGDL
jgi:hypothetical protein